MATYTGSPEFKGLDVSGIPGSNAVSAAGIVNLGNTYGTLRKNGPRYDELAATAIANRAQERATVLGIEGQIKAAGISAMGDIKSSKLIAEAQKSAAKSAASGSMMGSALGAIGSIGGALIGLSDESTKTAIEPIDSALEKLRELKPVTFYYKPEYGDHTRQHHGFVAQEFSTVLPDATYTDEATGKMCIDTGDVIGLLVRANQELEDRLTRLEAKSALQTV